MDASDGPPTLITERLRIRALQDDDVQALFGVYSDPEVMRYWDTPPHTDTSRVERLIAEAPAEFTSGQTSTWAIERAADGAVLGTITLMFMPTQPRAEIGYILGREYWGQGYAGEAQRRVIDHAFNDLGLMRLEADTHPDNTASIRSLERLGFKHEGTLRERWKIGGEISDSEIFGLLAREWSGA